MGNNLRARGNRNFETTLFCSNAHEYSLYNLILCDDGRNFKNLVATHGYHAMLIKNSICTTGLLIEFFYASFVKPFCMFDTEGYNLVLLPDIYEY
jgi:hypothetical protein